MPSMVTDSMMASADASLRQCATNERSSFTRWMGSSRGWVSDEKPLPKSSSTTVTPASRRLRVTCATRTGSASTVVSVISTSSASLGTPAVAAARIISGTLGELKPARRQVEHQARRVPKARPPDLELGARLAQQLAPHLEDEAALLGERDELDGAHQAALGMLPARQRLHGDHAHGLSSTWS